jgi:hypothetical protein
LSNTFPGLKSGTEVKIGKGNYQVSEVVPEKHNDSNRDINIHFSKDCSGIMHNNEGETCKITNTIR